MELPETTTGPREAYASRRKDDEKRNGGGAGGWRKGPKNLVSFVTRRAKMVLNDKIRWKIQ